MRARNKKWVDGELESNENLEREAKENKGKWREIFENDNDIHLEIGCGKGDFVIGMSQQNPNINYVAMEKEPQVIAKAVRKLRELEEIDGIERNILFVLGDANELLEYFEVGEIKGVYLNFSDPWRNRKKWNKRRLTHRGFLQKYLTLLDGQGAVIQKTDNRDLFEFSLNEFCFMDFKLKNISLDLHNSEFEGNVVTEYEEKFSSQGMPIYRVEAYVRQQ